MQRPRLTLVILNLTLLTLLASSCGSPPATDIAEESQIHSSPIATTDTPIALPPITATAVPSNTPIAPPPITPSAAESNTPIAPPPPRGTDTVQPPRQDKAPCQEPVHDGFQGIRDVDWTTLGCPSALPSIDVVMAKEGFEGGQMIWREDSRQIYVRYNSGSWRTFPDSWNEGQPEFSCPDIGTQNPPVPVRGFGKVWCEYSDVRNELGMAKNKERGFRGSIQDFLTGGHIIRMDTGKVYVLYPTGDWVGR